MAIVDVHAHLDTVENAEVLLESAYKQGVRDIIINTLDPSSFERAERFVHEHTKSGVRLHLACGLYPVNALRADIASGFVREARIDMHEAEALARTKRIIAIGEIGLDFRYATSPDERVEDERAFIHMLGVARELRLPAIIHSRKAEERVVELLAGVDVPCVLHAFSGKLRTLERALENPQVYFSIPLIVCHSEQVRGYVQRIPLDRLLTETDCPFMPLKGKALSEPGDIRNAIRAIAAIKDIDTREAERLLYVNAERVFAITEAQTI